MKQDKKGRLKVGNDGLLTVEQRLMIEDIYETIFRKHAAEIHDDFFKEVEEKNRYS